MKAKKRLLSLLLCGAMLFSLLPTTAFAAGKTVDVYTTTDLRNAVRNAGNGDTIRLQMDIAFPAGNYETVEDVYSYLVTTTLQESHVWERWLGRWKYYSQGTYPAFSIPAEYDPYGTGSTTYTAGKPDNKQRELDATCGLLIENKNLTIDLNGHSLTGTSGGIYLYSTVFVTGNSHVTIRGSGNVESNIGSALTAYGGDAKVTINGGHFKGAATAVSSVWNAEVAISGGTFEGPNWTERTADELIYIQYTLEGIAGPSGVGGTEFTRWRRRHTISGSRTFPVHGGALYTERNGRFTISGSPTVRAPEGGTLIYNRSSVGPGIVKIEGGTFLGEKIIHNDPGSEFPNISGGTFTTIPDYSDLKDYRNGTYAVFGLADGKYTIQPAADAEAKVKSGNQEAYYTNLSDALAVVKDGETVTLLKGHSQPVSLSANSNYTLDLGGMTVSNSITASAGTVTIRNGTVNYTGTGNAVATSGSASLTVNCTVNASSGTALYAGGGTLTVTSGTYWGGLGAGSGKLSLTGGKCSADPSDYLPEGCYAEKGSDDLYSIKVGLNDSGYMEIKNVNDLQTFAANVNNGDTDLNAILVNNINLEGIKWTPIASDSAPYIGTFDGNGYSIGNLNVHVSVLGNEKGDGYTKYIPGYAGLFAYVGSAGTIQNLNIGSGNVYGEVTDYGDIYVGAIAGRLQGKIVNCSNSANVTVAGKRQMWAGGIVGSGQTIEQCNNSGTVKVTSTNDLFWVYAGGIAGAGQKSNCYNTGAVSVKGLGKDVNASGIGGTNTSSSYNIGVLSAENDEGNLPMSHGSTYYLDSLAAPDDETATPKSAAQFKSGEVAYLLNGEKDAPNGPWYQTLGEDPYPVLDPTHAAVYYRSGNYVNAEYQSISNPTITTDGGISLVELVSKLPKTVDVTSTIGTSAADVTWNTDNIQYDPEDFNAQTFTITGTANVTGLLNGGEKPVTATVNVKAVTVNSLTVTTAPNLTYSQGGKLDLGGVRATANLSNGKAQIVEHDTEGVTFALGGQPIEDGASLDKEQHNGKTLTLSYGGKTVDLGALAVRSTNNFISALTVSGQEAQYENGGYAVTLPPYSSLPSADGITVTLADPSATVTGKTQISAGDSEARWQITVQAENGDPATYLLTVTVSPDYDRLNQTAVDEFTAAWNSLGEMSWTPTQAEVQQDETTAGATYEQQLTFWLTNQLFEAGLNIPDNATLEIAYTSGPDWATAGTRQDHDGTPGSFTFTATFTATAGEESNHKSVSFADNAGTITPTPYDAPAYTVNFDPQNGSAVSSAQVTEDTPIEEPDAPTRQDYRFTGWYKEATCETLWDFSDKVERDNMTLYAGWRWSQSHTEIDVARTQIANEDAFDAGEYGEGPRMGDTVTITAQATLTEEPGQTNTWNADPETFKFYLGDPDSGGELLDEVTATEEGGVYTAELKVDLTDEAGFAEGENTIYAVFSGGDQLDGSRASESLDIDKAMFTVTFSNTGDSEIENQYVEDGETASRPSDPTWEDYRFTGWKDGEQDFDFGEEITGNTDLTATWEWARSDTGVSIRLEQPGNPDAPTETGVYHIGDTVSVTATVKLADQPGTSNSINLMPDQFAFYVGDPDNGGTHLGTVEASVDGDGYTATLENITLGTTEGLADVGGYDIYAVFTGSDELNASREHTSLTVRPRLYTVTFDSDGGSTVKPQYVEDGGTIEEPEAPTRQDYRFTGWADEDGSPYDFSTTVTGPVELTAAWEWSKSETGVSIQWHSAGNPSAGENGAPIRMGDTVSITASVELAAQSNSMFLSTPEFVFYVGDPDHGGASLGTVSAQQTERGYTASLDVKLTDGNGFSGAGTYTIYAVFTGSGELDGSSDYATLTVAPAIYTVTFDSSGGTDVEEQYIEDGETVQKPQDPAKEGSYFKGWTQNGQSWDFEHDTVRSHMTLTAQWSAIPVFDITGSVTDQDGTALPNVEITLQQGKTEVFTTKTDEQGDYTFERVTPGLYNVVAKRAVGQGDQQTEQTVTILVEITDHNADAPTIKMPPENVNSVLELPDNAPDVVVDGLTDEAIAVAGKEENKGATVTVNMKVEPKAPVTGTPSEGSEAAQLQQEQQAIQQQAASRTLDFLEIAVVKEVTNSGSTNTTPITETSNILEIAVEFDFGNRENVTVYRYHDGQAQPLTETSSRTRAARDGTYYLDRANNLIHIFTQQFSLYAIGYTVPTPGGDTGGGGGGVSTYRITVEDSEHGEVKSSRASASQGSTVTLTVKPDAGYELSELIVTDSRGNEIDLTDKGDGKFTFTMPGRAVTVEAIFAEIEEEPQPWNNPFVDVRAGAWYYDAVRYVHEHGLMAGTSAKTFDPNVITTRGMIVTILYRLAGSPDIENRNWGYPYADVDSTAYYGTAVYWARLCGIVAGYSRDLFGPNDPITREQFAVMLYRFAGQPSAPDPTLTFSDADQVSGYASDAMRWAVGAGIISGKGNGILDPKGDATRAQAAAMLMRFCQKYMEK